MHEYNFGQTIVDMVIAESKKLDPPAMRVLKAVVVVGELRQLIPDYLKFAYETLTQGTVAQGSVLEIESKPVLGRCRACGWTGPLKAAFFKCGACGAGNAEITGGRELYLECLEVEQDD